MSEGYWKPVEGKSPEEISRAQAAPLEALAAGQVPALILRNAYPASECRRLVRHLVDEEVLYDPAGPVPSKFVEAAIPEGHYFKGQEKEASRAWMVSASAEKRRIDVGTSLGYRGADPAGFFAHANKTRELFAQLFADFENPVELLYRQLSALSGSKRAVTAYEPDGQVYGPAIVRAHYGSYTYKPHFDSVRLRESRENYAVYKFEHQFAGVLVLQNAERNDDSAQSIIHRYLWQSEVQADLEANTFGEFARERGITSRRVVLEPGDLYFFNTRLIHEVPGLDGEDPRVVLATFIGYSRDEDEIFVWS